MLVCVIHSFIHTLFAQSTDDKSKQLNILKRIYRRERVSDNGYRQHVEQRRNLFWVGINVN